ncbi:MAG TPA: carboxypeptidase-like regulatory domain-containing protein [Terriglobia bacterium]|nr:carboxypeptidase-like regulatory domain-containing protein [Terriglobia bacterium]
MKKVVLLFAATCLLFSVPAWCQDTANIVGTVSDSTGAVIPNAKVTISNPDKAFTRDLVSNSAGYFEVSAVPIGNYVVTAEATGFQKLVRSGITLNVGQTQRIDMQLTVGQVTEQVNVTGNVTQVQTENATVSGVITSTQIQNLSLNGRNWVSLALLVPGASPDNGLNTTDVGVAGNNSISFNGNRLQYSNWEIDGGNNTDEGSASTFNTYPSIDTIAEFRISTSNYGAEMGKHAGANIELATKSGTRTFHGDAYEYVRNDALDANPFFTNRSCLGCKNAPKAPYKWNDYGYTFGGPFYIPGHYNTDKSKTFFFWSEEWKVLRKSTSVSSDVPTPAERGGDFSQCDKASPNYNSVVANGCTLPTLGGVNYDTVQAMPGFNAQAFTNAQDLLNGLVPLPNNGSLVNYFANASAPTNWRQEQIRIDQNISDKTQVFFRYTQDTWNTVSVPSLWQWASFDTIKTQFGGPGESAVFHITHTFKPTLMNEFVAAYTTDHILLYPQAGVSSVAGSINRPSNFAVSHLFSANNSNPLLPALEMCGGTEFCFNEDAGNTPWFNSNPIVTWKDNLSWVHGNHTTKTGFYLENYRKNEQFGSDTQGDLQFGGGGNITTKNALADAMLGRVQYYSEGTQAVNGVPVGGYPKGHWQSTDLEPYIQDDWKIKPNLTLNLGVRYYIYSRIHDVSRPTIDSGFLPNQYNAANEAQLNISGALIPGSGAIWTNYGNGLVECGANGIPKGCQLANTWGNIAPRFGFAWDPFGKGTTSIRGGYGIYYESGNGNEAQTEGGEGNPPSVLAPQAFNILGYSNIVANGPLGPTGYTSFPYSQAWPSVQQYNLTFEHQFGNNLVSVAYVGNVGRHLARAVNLNAIHPGATTMNVPAYVGVGKTGGNSGSNGGPNDTGTQICDMAGNCNVQQAQIFQEIPSIFFVPYSGYSGIQYKQNTAVSDYNALQTTLRHTSHGLTMQAAYTWSHTIDDSSSTYEQNFTAVSDYQQSRFKGTSDLNRTNILELSYIYAIPFFKNSTNSFARQALGGWQITGTGSFFSGQPVTFECGVNGYSTGVGGSAMCNTVGKVQIQKGTFNDATYGPTPTWWNPATVTQPLFSQLAANGEPGMFGYMGRNVLTGPGRNNWDMAMEKNFSLPWFSGEHSTVQFRLETFNTFNHTQWNGFNYGCSGSNGFGESCADNTNSPGEVNSTWDPRILQIALKFIF